MATVLAQDKPYERFSTGQHGLAPALTVNPSAGTEEMLIGMDLLENWLVALDGPRRLFSITHP